MNFFTKFEPFTRTGKNWNRLVDILAIYGFAVLAVAAAMGLRLALTARFGSGLPPYITFYPAVMAVAMLTGFGPGVLATAVSWGIAVYWILPPLGQFAVASPIDRVALIIFIGMGLFVSVTAELYRRNRRLKAIAYDHEVRLRKSQEALRKSDEEFRLLVEGTPDYAIFIIDPEGIIVSWNPGAERIKGFQAKEVIGQHFSLFHPQEAVESGLFTQALKLAKAEGRFEAEGWRMRKDGSRFWAHIIITALRDDADNLKGFSKIIRDLTQQKKAEAALVESSRQIKGIVESAMDAIISVDAEQRIVVFNNAAEIMFRCAAREAIGSRIDRFIPQRFQAAHAGHIRSFWRMGETRRAMGSLSAISGLRADGEEFPIEAAISQTEAGGQPVFTVILRDITKRKQAEEALRISESRLRRFYESGLIGVIYWSTNGKITDANDKFLEMTGYDREDLAAGRLNWEQMTPPEFRYLDERALAEVKVTGIVSQPFEKEYIRKDGSRLPVLLAGAILDEVFQEGALSFWTPASARL